MRAPGEHRRAAGVSGAIMGERGRRANTGALPA
jgi:hypothetical protein